MNDQINTPPVPYIVYDEEQARNERNIKRLVIALIISICLIFATNALWLYCWFQWDYVGEETVATTHTIDVDAKDGTANYIGNNGDIISGADSSNYNDSKKTDESQKEVR
jgi:hypothetical protein